MTILIYTRAAFKSLIFQIIFQLGENDIVRSFAHVFSYSEVYYRLVPFEQCSRPCPACCGLSLGL